MRVRRKWLVVVVGVVLAVVIVAAGAFAGQRLMGRKQPPTAEAPAGRDVGDDDGAREPVNGATGPEAPANQAGFVEFRHDPLGIAISHPANWRRIPRPQDPQVLLLAAGSPQESFLLRTIALGEPIPPEKIPEMRQLTDQMVTSGAGVKLLAEPRQIELAGLPGYYYFYSFQDAQTGQTGAHAHYFLAKGDRIIILVFQALPLEEFPRLAPVFDQIAESLRLLQG
ncbi:MAG: hypothetical protein M3252_00310 [Actinomycetota bacterium]|nr:hypothetical protein [Actinomycetota bacterium]